MTGDSTLGSIREWRQHQRDMQAGGWSRVGRAPDLSREAEVLRELVREAHGATKDLRAATAEARKMAPAIVREQLNGCVAEAMEELGRAMPQFIEDAEARVMARFDRLAATLLGEDAEGRRTVRDEPSLREMAEELARPAGVVLDPRELGGGFSGPGGPHDRRAVAIDTKGAVLLDEVDVVIADRTAGGPSGAIGLLLSGRVNGTKDRAKILFIMNEDGASAVVTEVEALVRRGAPEGWAKRYGRAKARREEAMRRDGTWDAIPTSTPGSPADGERWGE